MSKDPKLAIIPTYFYGAFDPDEKRYVRLIRMTQDSWGNDKIIGIQMTTGNQKSYYPDQLQDYYR